VVELGPLRPALFGNQQRTSAAGAPTQQGAAGKGAVFGQRAGPVVWMTPRLSRIHDDIVTPRSSCRLTTMCSMESEQTPKILSVSTRPLFQVAETWVESTL